MSREDKDYTRQDQIVRTRKERELDKLKDMAEASESQVRGILEKALQDDRTRQNVGRDCLEGYQGKKGRSLGTEDKLGRNRDAGGYNLVDEPLPTGYEKYPWDDE